MRFTVILAAFVGAAACASRNHVRPPATQSHREGRMAAEMESHVWMRNEGSMNPLRVPKGCEKALQSQYRYYLSRRHDIPISDAVAFCRKRGMEVAEFLRPPQLHAKCGLANILGKPAFVDVRGTPEVRLVLAGHGQVNTKPGRSAVGAVVCQAELQAKRQMERRVKIQAERQVERQVERRAERQKPSKKWEERPLRPIVKFQVGMVRKITTCAPLDSVEGWLKVPEASKEPKRVDQKKKPTFKKPCQKKCDVSSYESEGESEGEGDSYSHESSDSPRSCSSSSFISCSRNGYGSNGSCKPCNSSKSSKTEKPCKPRKCTVTDSSVYSSSESHSYSGQPCKVAPPKKNVTSTPHKKTKTAAPKAEAVVRLDKHGQPVGHKQMAPPKPDSRYRNHSDSPQSAWMGPPSSSRYMNNSSSPKYRSIKVIVKAPVKVPVNAPCTAPSKAPSVRAKAKAPRAVIVKEPPSYRSYSEDMDTSDSDNSDDSLKYRKRISSKHSRRHH